MTYPRSGNTFLRKYLELITGITTGSEVEANVWHLPLIGEQIVDDRVWVVKSHGPITRVISCEDFSMNKIIVLMRNPFAVIISMVHMCQTYSHFKQLDHDFAKENPKFWQKHIEQQIQWQLDFFEYVAKLKDQNKVPILFLKFEELKDEAKETLENTFKFMLGVSDLSGTVIEKRIEEAIVADSKGAT